MLSESVGIIGTNATSMNANTANRWGTSPVYSIFIIIAGGQCIHLPQGIYEPINYCCTSVVTIMHVVAGNLVTCKWMFCLRSFSAWVSSSLRLRKNALHLSRTSSSTLKYLRRRWARRFVYAGNTQCTDKCLTFANGANNESWYVYMVGIASLGDGLTGRR